MKRNKQLLAKSSGSVVLRIVPPVIALLFLLSSPGRSFAISLSGDSSTYVQSKQASDKTKILGGYEYLDFAVRDIGGETISFHTGGWLRYDLKEQDAGGRSDSDLQYSYLSIKRKTDNTVVNLGRVMVFEGVAAERVDGLYARTDLMGGFGVAGFGGSPVETGADLPGNSMIYGGRLSHQMGGMYKIGVSALKEEKNDLDYRQEGGLDLWVHPVNKVDLSGTSSYNSITKGWMEHSYSLALGPFDKLRLDTTGSLIDYDHYFYRTTAQSFSLRPGLIEPHEKLRILGEEASYQLTDKLLISAEYRDYDYDIAGKGHSYAGKLRYSVSEAGGAGVSYRRMQGETDALRYSEYRAYGYGKLGHLDVSADVLQIHYAKPINGEQDALSATLAAQYTLTEAWKLGADAEYARNPEFSKDISTFLKLLYHFGAKGGV